MSFALIAVALAAPEPVELAEDAFVIDTPAGALHVAQLVVPEGAAKDAEERICRFRFEASEPGAVEAVIDRCPEALKEATSAAARAWKVELQQDADEAPGLPAELEIWVRFGLDAREVPELFVRGDWRHEPTLPAGVLPVPLSAVELPAPMFPQAELDAGTLGAECTVDVDLSHRGYLLSKAVVRGCAEPFADAVVAASERWRFRTPRVGQEPSAVSSSLGVVFEAVPGAQPGTLDGDVRVIVPAHGTKELVKQLPPRRQNGIPKNAEPLLVLDHDPYAEVEIMGWSWPELEPSGPGRCELLVQVDARRRTVVWPESCPDELRDPTVEAVRSWSLQAGTIEAGERYGRFRAAMVFTPGSDPHLVVPEGDVVVLAEEAAARVHTFQEPVTRSRVAPKIPKDLGAAEECVVTVEVGSNGKPSTIEPVSCSDAAFSEAKKAVKQWRWDPAREDGKPLPWSTTVKLRFAAG